MATDLFSVAKGKGDKFFCSDAGKGKTYFRSVQGGNCSTCHYADSKRLAS